MNYPDIGGFDLDREKQRWPAGSIFEAEGQKIYDIVRKYKPHKVIEVGAWYGCSTTWIAAALRDNEKGKLYSLDIGIGSWSMVDRLAWKDYVYFWNCDALKYKNECDILFLDGDKRKGFAKTIFENIKAKIVIMHDWIHPEASLYYKPEFIEAFGEPDEVFGEKHMCGLAIKYNGNLLSK
jgi:hypothetical protein